MLDLVRGYYTTSMALYPDEKRTWQELHHALLLQQMLEHFLKGWPVLFVFHLDSKVAHSDTVSAFITPSVRQTTSSPS